MHILGINKSQNSTLKKLMPRWVEEGGTEEGPPIF